MALAEEQETAQRLALSSYDIDVYWRTTWGEARGESWEGKVAVAWVIKNRSLSGKWFGGSISEVCLKPWQFSCWNENDPNREKCEAIGLDDTMARECLAASMAAWHDLLPDPTHGSTHYHAEGVQPDWSQGQEPAAVIGKHLFYRGIA